MFYDIEYAHIYADEEISLEQAVTIRSAQQLKDTLLAAGHTVRLSVLIDDYNVTQVILDAENYAKQLERIGLLPDVIYSEASMITAADQLLHSAADHRTARSYNRYIKKHNKYPCSLLLAAWHSSRLSDEFIMAAPLWTASSGQNLSTADKAVSILPERYREVEDIGAELIESSPHKELLHRVERFYV